MNDDILKIFESEKLDVTKLENAFDIQINKLTFGMSPFQIKHFVLNRREFPTDFAQFLQSRMEIYHRLNIIIDLYYQYRECVSKSKLAEGRIEKISDEETYEKIKEAKIELQKLEIDKNSFKMVSIKNQAEDKLKELYEFYNVYKKYKDFESGSQKVIEEVEEEYWKIKSAYYPELWERYGLTPKGFSLLPHENGGLDSLIKLHENNIKLLNEK